MEALFCISRSHYESPSYPHFIPPVCIIEYAILSFGVIMYVSLSLNCEFHEGRDICFCHCLLRTQKYLLKKKKKYLLDESLNEGIND